MTVQVGKITHYFNNIGVAVVAVSDLIKVGDRVKISGHDKEYEQEITSMQIDKKQIPQAKKGDSVGLKVEQQVKEGDLVYRE